MRSLLVAGFCLLISQNAFAQIEKIKTPKFAVHFEENQITFDGYACAPDFILDLMLEENRRAKLLKSLNKIGLTIKGEPSFKQLKDGDKHLGFEFQFKINEKLDAKAITELAEKIPGIVLSFLPKDHQEKIKIATELAKLVAEKPIEVDGTITITGLTALHKENTLKESLIKLKIEFNYKPAN